MKTVLIIFCCLITCIMPMAAHTPVELMLPGADSIRYVALPSGVRIGYTDSGAGEQTLLMVHGLGSNHQSWQKNIAGLRAHFRCVALDLPGYGVSGKGEFAFDMVFFAETVASFIQTLNLQNVVLVGHSMGAQVSMHVALRNAGLVQKLVLLAPAGFETFTEQEKAWFGAVYTPALLKSTSPEQIRKNFEANFFQFPADAEYMISDRMALRASDDYDAYCAMIPRCVMGMLNQPVYEQLPSITIPTLVIYGEEDKLIPNRFLHKTLDTRQVALSGQSRLPQSSLLFMPAAGHFVQWEAAAAVNQAIDAFLKS